VLKASIEAVAHPCRARFSGRDRQQLDVPCRGRCRLHQAVAIPEILNGIAKVWAGPELAPIGAWGSQDDRSSRGSGWTRRLGSFKELTRQFHCPGCSAAPSTYIGHLLADLVDEAPQYSGAASAIATCAAVNAATPAGARSHVFTVRRPAGLPGQGHLKAMLGKEALVPQPATRAAASRIGT